MRRPIVFLIGFVVFLTLLVWAFSIFIQPKLPQGINSSLYIFFLALAGVAGVVAAFLQFLDYRKGATGQIKIDEKQAKRNRENMLQLVWNTWIEGVLHQSLYNEMRIELGMETRPDAIEHPWDMVIQMPDQEPKQVPPGTTMLELFDNYNGALLILGEPGSGKTTMLLELAGQAIKRAQNDSSQPIPVIFNLSSWTPVLKFDEWLVSELKLKYYIPPKISRILVEQNDLTLLLDGLDEVTIENRKACLQAINDFREEYGIPLAICSRSQEYDALTLRSNLCGAVMILPLTDREVNSYLRKYSPGLTTLYQSLASNISQLDQKAQEVERKFLYTPLFLSILVLALRHASDEEKEILKSAGDYRKILFDQFIAQMFKRKGVDRHYRIEDTKRWLAWIAHSMIEHGQSLFYVEDIQPSWLPFSVGKRKLIVGLIVGLIGGLSVGLLGGLLAGLLVGLIVGLLFGLIGGLLFGLIGGVNIAGDSEPTDKLIWSWKGFLRGLIVGLIFGLIVGLIVGLVVGLIFGLSGELIVVLIGELIVVLIGGLIFGLSEGLSSETILDRNSPSRGITVSLKYSLIMLLIVGLIFGLIFGLSGGLIFGLIGGLSVGLLFWLIYGGAFVIKHYLSRILLYREGNIPWNLVCFLDYCTQRIILRRVGGGYIFIHRMLMEHYAAMKIESYGKE